MISGPRRTERDFAVCNVLTGLDPPFTADGGTDFINTLMILVHTESGGDVWILKPQTGRLIASF